MRFEVEIKNLEKENEVFFAGFYSTVMAKYFPLVPEASLGKQKLTGAELVKILNDGMEEYYKRLVECGYNEDFIGREQVRMEGLWGKDYEKISLGGIYEVARSAANLCACEISRKRLPEFP